MSSEVARRTRTDQTIKSSKSSKLRIRRLQQSKIFFPFCLENRRRNISCKQKPVPEQRDWKLEEVEEN